MLNDCDLKLFQCDDENPKGRVVERRENSAALDPEPNRKSQCSLAPCPGSLVMLPSSGLMTRASHPKFSGLYLSSIAPAEQEELGSGAHSSAAPSESGVYPQSPQGREAATEA